MSENIMLIIVCIFGALAGYAFADGHYKASFAMICIPFVIYFGIIAGTNFANNQYSGEEVSTHTIPLDKK